MAQNSLNAVYSNDGARHRQCTPLNGDGPYRISNDASLVYDKGSHAITCCIACDGLDSYDYRGPVQIGTEISKGIRPTAERHFAITLCVIRLSHLQAHSSGAGLAAFVGHVKGAWTEQVPDGLKEHRATVVKVVVADFNEIK